MSHLRELVRRPSDEARLQRNWRAIDARRSTSRERRAPLAVVAVGGAAAAAAVAAALWLLIPRASAPAPLATADGRPWTSVDHRVTELADGSRIVMHDGAQLELLDNSERTVELVLRRGAAEFEITPGGPRQWTVEAGGGVRVEVVGTRFVVRRDPSAVEVEVERGAVIVRAPSLPDGLARLNAGERVRVDRETGHAPRRPAAPPDEDEDEVVREPGPPAAEETAPPMDAGDLLERADEAAAGDRPEVAARILRRLMNEHPRDPRVPMAAVRLGRIELRRLEHYDRAARAFAWALARGVPSELDEDVRAMHVEALARAGRREEARRAAEVLGRRHPEGRWSREVRRWID